MSFVFNPHLLCPLDGESLVLDGPQCRCARGHAFDLAKQGYLNLLPVQQKKSLNPGDNRQMVKARAAFLNAGHYRSIAETVVSLIGPHASSVLDAGCGEGYYTQLVRQALDASVSVIGMDISKEAVLASAKRKQAITWLVASNKSIPLADASVDVVLCAFGFPVWGEFKRVLRPGGRVLIVDAGERHLYELRERVYDEVVVKPLPLLDDALMQGFVLEREERVREVLSIQQPAINHLLMMTPHGYRISDEKRRRMDALDALSCHVDVALRVLRRGD